MKVKSLARPCGFNHLLHWKQISAKIWMEVLHLTGIARTLVIELFTYQRGKWLGPQRVFGHTLWVVFFFFFWEFFRSMYVIPFWQTEVLARYLIYTSCCSLDIFSSAPEFSKRRFLPKIEHRPGKKTWPHCL